VASLLSISDLSFAPSLRCCKVLVRIPGPVEQNTPQISGGSCLSTAIAARLSMSTQHSRTLAW